MLLPVSQEEVERRHAIESTPYLEHGLSAAEWLAAHAYAPAKVLALDALPDITLPAPHDSAADQAHLRAIASLYLLSQLESALLLPAVDLLAGLSVTGGLQVDLGTAAAGIMDFWRHRSERFSAEERRSLFARLFGPEFDDLMINLCEALYKLDEGVLTRGASNPLQQAKVRTLSQQLAEHLLDHTTSESAFAAEDLLATTRTATEILKDPQVEHAFGANTIWKTVEAILRRAGAPIPDFASFVMRGKAGMTIVAWLADARGFANSTKPLVGLDHPVISAAVDWLETSLTIEQLQANKQSPTANKESA